MNIKKKLSINKYSLSDRVFLAVNTLILFAMFIIFIYPLLFVLSASFSSGISVMNLSLLPARPSLAGYKAVFNYKDIWTGYYNSLIYMAVGTLVSLLVTICCAYPLSRKDFMGRAILLPLCVITMYISGGLIPTYMTVRQLGLTDTMWAVILPGAMSVYNMIVMRTFFQTQIPEELRESAQLDGCNNMQFLLRIALPLSGSILAVIGLFYAVGYWNSYFGPMIYLSSRSKFPLTIILREILITNTASIEIIDIEEMMALEERQNLMKYAVMVVAALPVMILYPFVQKHFVKGVMIGALKG
ncbi:MAG: carbohydrate ABC transporter permease [Christensenellales bacterium]